MRIKEIEARLAAIKQEIEQRGDAMTAAEIDALEQETTQLTEERAGLIAAAEKRNGILDNIAKGAGIVSRSFQQNNGDDNAAPDDPFGTPEYRSAWLKNIRRLPLNDAEKRAFSNASGAGAEVIPTQTANEIISKVKTLAPMLNEVTLLASIKVSAVKEIDGGKRVEIYPNGKDKHGVRNAEKGFVLNYGRSNMPARPWFTAANEKAADDVVSEMRRVWEEKQNEER